MLDFDRRQEWSAALSPESFLGGAASLGVWSRPGDESAVSPLQLFNASTSRSELSA
jgi:hypothetical protein